jgi:Ser/Thr protein kinase RdoA (MazF antagonist)
MVWFQDRILAKIDQEFLNEILAEWGVGKLSYFRPVSGWQNLGILVKVKRKEYFLRFYRPRTRAKEKIYFELNLSIHLAKKGLPAARAYETKDGKFLIFRQIAKSKIPIALFQFLKGQTRFDFSDKEIATASHLIGKIHNALVDFPSRPRTFVWYPSPHLAVLARQIKKGAKDESTEHLFEKDYVLEKKIFLKYNKNLLPRALIHGDFHFANLLFSDSQISGVFDFDAAKFATPMWDLAIFLGNVKIQFWEHQDRDVSVKKLQKIILEGYLREAKLEKQEILLFSYLIRLFFWQKVAWAKQEIEAGNLWTRQVLDWSILALKEKF